MAQSRLLKVGNGVMVVGPAFGPVVAECLEPVLNTFCYSEGLGRV